MHKSTCWIRLWSGYISWSFREWNNFCDLWAQK